MNWISDRAEIADFGDQGHAQHAGGQGREGEACGVHRLQSFVPQMKSRHLWRHLWQHLEVQEVAKECHLVDTWGYGSQIWARCLKTVKSAGKFGVKRCFDLYSFMYVKVYMYV